MTMPHLKTANDKTLWLMKSGAMEAIRELIEKKKRVGDSAHPILRELMDKINVGDFLGTYDLLQAKALEILISDCADERNFVQKYVQAIGEDEPEEPPPPEKTLMDEFLENWSDDE